MPPLSLNLFGSFQVTLDQKPVTGFKSNKVRALLAYLATEADRPHSRETLAGLLWPDQPDQTALSNLRYALANLRRVIGDRAAEPPFLLISRRALQFNLNSHARIDVLAFSQNLSDRQDPLSLGDIDRLTQTVALYRGHFLEEFFVSNSAPFEEWVVFKREQFARQAIAALRHLAQLHEQCSEYPAAQQYAWRQLQLEPWQEDAHRQLMRLLALSGRRNAALAQYQTCRQVLADALGVEPMPETTTLYENIRDGRLDRKTPPPTPARRPEIGLPSPELAPRPAGPVVPFVARERELAKLDTSLQRALAGQGQVIFVTGEAGRGKTALIGEFIRQAMARHADLAVAGGSCNAQSGLGDPYLPFREILQMLTGDVEAKRAGGEISRDHAYRLWRVMPAVVQTLLDSGPDLIDLFVPGPALALRAEAFSQWPGRTTTAPAWSAQSAAQLAEVLNYKTSSAEQAPIKLPQTDLFEQVTRVLLAVAHQYPLVLVLDDLQWADNGSVSLLFHLARSLANSRILLVGAYRPDELALEPESEAEPERHPLRPVVNELQREFGDIRIDLNQVGGRDFVDALLDTELNDLDDAFRQTLTHHTDGNPLFTVELLRGLQTRGDLVRDEAGRWVTGPSLNWEQLPTRVEAVIAERIERLLPEWQAMLAAASVEGETFTAEVVAQVQGGDEQTIIRRLSGALSKQHRLVKAHSLERLDGRRLSRYRFRHHLFQKYLYNRLDEVERAHLHEAVGTVLESLYQSHAAEAEALAPQLAYHFEAAGLAEKAADYLLRAGQRAVRMSASVEAIALFTHGLALLETLPESPERAQQELNLRLALNGPLFAIRGWGATERARITERAYELCRQIGETSQFFIQTIFLQADLCRAGGEYQASLDLGEQLLNLAQRSQAPTHFVLAHFSLGETQFFRGQLPLARAHLEQAITCGDAHPQCDLLAMIGLDAGIGCRDWLSLTLWMLGYPDQALARSREALALAQTLNQPLTLSLALAFAGCTLYLLRREPELAWEHLAALTRMAPHEDLTIMQAWVNLYQGWQKTTQGQVAAGIAQMQEGMAAWQAIGGVVKGSSCWPLIEVYAGVGYVEEGLNLVNETLAVINQTDERLFEVELCRLKGELLLKACPERSRRDEAEGYFLQAIEISRQQQAKSWELRATMSLARLWQQNGWDEEARQMLAEIYNWFSEGFDTPDLQEAKALLEALSANSERDF